MTITINLSPELERALRETSAARGMAAEEFVVGALSASLQTPAPKHLPPQLSPAESKLLTVINRGLTESQWQRYRALVARRQAEALTAAEHQELTNATDQLEQLHLERLESLAELARLRGSSLPEVMLQLDIRPPTYE